MAEIVQGKCGEVRIHHIATGLLAGVLWAVDSVMLESASGWAAGAFTVGMLLSSAIHDMSCAIAANVAGGLARNTRRTVLSLKGRRGRLMALAALLGDLLG